MDAPPMDALGGFNGGIEPNMPNEPMPNDMDMNPQDNDDDEMEGFDAGVDADSETDPKKYIQQLTGKLSQELRKYNEEQPNPDEDLNKYVAGMIIPQASKGLTDKGKNEVIKKVKSGTVGDSTEDNEDDEEDVQMESINEITNNILDDDFNKKNRESKITNKTLPKKSPFRCNR